MKHDLLIEIGCEDLPARYVWPLAQALAHGVTGGLDRRGIAHAGARTYATPRRIAVLAHEVAAQQPDQPIERRGPALGAAFKDGKPTPAALGFAKSCGVEFGRLERLETEKGAWLVYRSIQPGRRTAELVPELFEDTLKSMDELVPKRMRWGTGEETFVRPVQWLLALFGGDVIPLKRFGLVSGRVTYGHRFHAPEAISLANPHYYEDKLKHARVWVDFASRRTEIWRQIEAEALRLGGDPHRNDELLDEVTALVEWPVVLSGRMEERFMALPPEVIIATVEHNQRYFPVFAPAGTGVAAASAAAAAPVPKIAAEAAPARLLPLFITISNIESRDKTQVIVGNERVVRPRLSDALFFWEQDRKKPLEAYTEVLTRVTFQKALGSIADKTRRIVAISAKINEVVETSGFEVERAANLCKADLVTRMVYEFPELQGVMGGYYARASGETEAVAQAIREHYQPTQSGGPIPASPIGRIVALADKLDTLAGIFAIGQKPTASKDPYALRRAALGVLRILVEGELDLDLRELLAAAALIQPGVKNAASLVEELLQFHWDRLRGYYTEAGLRWRSSSR